MTKCKTGNNIGANHYWHSNSKHVVNGKTRAKCSGCGVTLLLTHTPWTYAGDTTLRVISI